MLQFWGDWDIGARRVVISIGLARYIVGNFGEILLAGKVKIF
jgi:hypothetical protein